jgi:DNA-binding GntR family transcriptional regulator
VNAPSEGFLTKTETAYREIRTSIEAGDLPPGSRLLTVELEQTLGMSPTPIREALRLLQRDGLVEHRPHRGTVVADFAGAHTASNSLIRLALEPLATELATVEATKEELAKIQSLHTQFRTAVEREPAGLRPPELNAQWHLQVYRTSHSPTLIEFIEKLWRVMGMTRYFSIHGERSVTEHQAVVDAMVARDATEAGRLMREHLRSVSSDLDDRAPR